MLGDDRANSGGEILRGQGFSGGCWASRLYHLCMDIVTTTLKQCSKNPVEMCDAEGFLRRVRAILLAHIADYPEQQLIACASGSASPISVAVGDGLGSRHMQPLRTGKVILERIRQLVTKPNYSVTVLGRYVKARRDLQLNGVYAPFWRDWLFAEPSIFLTPDILHQWHRFFYDHLMKWRDYSSVTKKSIDVIQYCKLTRDIVTFAMGSLGLASTPDASIETSNEVS